MKKKEVNHKRGRPSIFTQDLADLICYRIATGESVRKICKDEDMPEAKTIYLWLLEEGKRDFLQQYNQARAVQAELMFEELAEIADESQSIIRGDDKSDSARVQANKLRVDTRKWYLSKVLPKKFGEKLDLTSEGKRLPTPILANALPENVSNNDSNETGSIPEEQD